MHQHAGGSLSSAEWLAYAHAALFVQNLCLPTLDLLGGGLEDDSSHPSPVQVISHIGHTLNLLAATISIEGKASM